MAKSEQREHSRCSSGYEGNGVFVSRLGEGYGVAVAGLVGLLLGGGAHAAGQVSSIETSLRSATPFVYTADGIEYQWGAGSNQIMEGFSVDGRSFSYAQSADRVEIQRHDIPGVTTGQPCGIFVERLELGSASRQFSADYPSDGSGTGNCDMAALLASRVLNRGAIDLFSNQLPDAKNIERLDYIFDYGLLTPVVAESMEFAGHTAAEKSANNPVKMAAILSVDVLGQPASYGPLVRIEPQGCSDPALCYGMTDLQHSYSFLQNDFNEPQSYPVETERSYESVGMAYVSVAKLGLQPGQRYYGFSVFADDVSADEHDLLDPSTFPTDTSSNFGVPGDDADIYGGLSGYFVSNDLSRATGAVFVDVDGDGQPSDDNAEAGVSDIGVSFYQDVNGNGAIDADVDLLMGESIDSDKAGQFVLPGVPDGNYLVLMDETDPELPPGLVSVPGSNPVPLSVVGGVSEPVYFPFSDSGSGGTTDGGTTDGGTTDGGTTDGGTTDGGTTDGGTTDGGTTDGGTTDGGIPPNDATTDAIDDEFDVNQGQTTSLDVLANDVDGVGDGLTLISVSESQNATLSVVDNQVSYEPAFGFYGNDAFLYVMRDADGTELTGNVAVRVVRYSDLNNNGLNDYDECDCDNLTLETGVNGSGVGGLSLYGVGVLLLGISLRQGRRRRLMRRTNEEEL